MKDSTLKIVQKVVNAPDFILPWLDRFYEPLEIKVLEKVNLYPMTAVSLQDTMNITGKELERLFLRGIFSKNKDGNLEPADFHARYDIWALFEGFKDIPQAVRDNLNQWELDYYILSHEAEVEQIRQTGRLDPLKILPRYLLLEEAYEVLDSAEHVYLWPCNCRAMIQACRKPIYTCLRFDNSQGQGYEISREKAKEIVLDSNKKGLMQSGELGRDMDGNLTGAICNCCPDCCFPHLLAREMKAEKLWPKSGYTANWIQGECSFCGLCARRCPFQAFVYDKKKADKQTRLTFSRELCRGCGLCAVTCPTNAIEMNAL